MSRITLRLDDDEKTAFKNWCDKQGKSMSEVLKADIKEHVGVSVNDPLPDEPDLAKAYRRLWQLRDQNDKLPVTTAESQIANRLNIPTDTVRNRILTQLDDRGYITVTVGVIKLCVDLEPETAGTEVVADD